MKQAKKTTITLILIVIFIILGKNQSNAGNQYLNSLNFDTKVNEDGSMNIVETWDINISETNTLFKTFKYDQTKYTKITDVTVAEITNGDKKEFTKINELMYHVTKDCYYARNNDSQDFEIAWGVGLDNTRATKKYEISYKVVDAIAKYNDYAELYWQYIGKDFSINCNKITGTITLPKNANSKEDIKVWGHTQGLNGEIYAKNSNQIEFQVNNFGSGTYVEIRSLFPVSIINNSGRNYSKNILDIAIEEETIWAKQANELRKKIETTKNIVYIFFIGISLIVIIYTIKSTSKILKKSKEKQRTVPDNELKYYRDLPRKDATPAGAVYVLEEINSTLSTRQFGNIFSANLLDLSLKKHVSFNQDARDEKNIIINILKEEADENLSKNEKVTFDYIKKVASAKKSITVKDIERYMSLYNEQIINIKKEIENETKKELLEKDVYDLENIKEKNKYSSSILMNAIFLLTIVFVGLGILPMFISINKKLTIFMVLSVIILEIIKIIVTKRYLKKLNIFTKKGANEKQMWIGLKNYMEDFSMLDKRDVPEVVLWEHFLVYATAFGIADKVIKELKAFYKEIGQGFEFDSNYNYMNYMINNQFARNFSNSISSAICSSYTSAMSSTYSSGNGMGGGFSGGGGGGRRTVVGGRRSINIELDWFILKPV